jgi:hypothetical protein
VISWLAPNSFALNADTGAIMRIVINADLNEDGTLTCPSSGRK